MPIWRKAILTAVFLLVLNPLESRSEDYSGEITLDPVISQVGPGEINIGQIVLWLRVSYDDAGAGDNAWTSNSFILYSLDQGEQK